MGTTKQRTNEQESPLSSLHPVVTCACEERQGGNTIEKWWFSYRVVKNLFFPIFLRVVLRYLLSESSNYKNYLDGDLFNLDCPNWKCSVHSFKHVTSNSGSY